MISDLGRVNRHICPACLYLEFRVFFKQGNRAPRLGIDGFVINDNDEVRSYHCFFFLAYTDTNAEYVLCDIAFKKQLNVHEIASLRVNLILNKHAKLNSSYLWHPNRWLEIMSIMINRHPAMTSKTRIIGTYLCVIFLKTG